MATPDLTTVMTGLQTALATIDGLRAYDIQPDQFAPPAAWVGLPEDVTYHGAMARGLTTYRFRVGVAVSAASDRVGQHAIAGYLQSAGASSVHAALWADRTLGGTVSDTITRSAKPLGLVNITGIDCYAAEWAVDVMVPGA